MTQASSHDLLPPRAHGGSDDAIDPELLELPDPPKAERTATVALLLVTALASLAMVLVLMRDAAFAFAPQSASDLGELGSTPAAAFVDNGYVHGTAMLGAAHAIRYERPMVAGSFRLMPVAGRPDVWAEVRVPEGGENSRYVPPREVGGRLVRFDEAGPRHRGLASAVQQATGQRVPDGAFLLIDGETPASARWAIALVVMFLGFAAWNVAMTAKLLRRVSA